MNCPFHYVVQRYIIIGLQTTRINIYYNYKNTTTIFFWGVSLDPTLSVQHILTLQIVIQLLQTF